MTTTKTITKEDTAETGDYSETEEHVESQEEGMLGSSDEDEAASSPKKEKGGRASPSKAKNASSPSKKESARTVNGDKAPRNSKGSPNVSSRDKFPKTEAATNIVRKVIATGGVKKQRRYKPGTVALREIRREQRNTSVPFAKAPFIRLIREIAQDYKNDIRFSPEACAAIMEATTSFGVSVMQDTLEIALNAKRKTIMPKDMLLVRKLAPTANAWSTRASHKS